MPTYIYRQEADFQKPVPHYFTNKANYALAKDRQDAGTGVTGQFGRIENMARLANWISYRKMKMGVKKQPTLPVMVTLEAFKLLVITQAEEDANRKEVRAQFRPHRHTIKDDEKYDETKNVDDNKDSAN
jgi:hypothetical protein